MSSKFGLLLAALCAPALVSSVLAEDWVVSRITGQGWVTAEGGARVAAAAGMTVEAGSSVRTGAGSRAILVHGADTMLLSAGTAVTIPARADQGLSTTVYQQVGTIDLTVEKRSAPHFSVQTPYLAAIVKGTIFKVSVDERAAKVSVSRGVVGVADLKSGERADVRAGQIAGTSPTSGGLEVSGVSSKPAVRPGPPQRSKVSAARSGLTNPQNQQLAEYSGSSAAAATSATSDEGSRNSETVTAGEPRTTEGKPGKGGKTPSGSKSGDDNNSSTSGQPGGDPTGTPSDDNDASEHGTKGAPHPGKDHTNNGHGPKTTDAGKHANKGHKPKGDSSSSTPDGKGNGSDKGAKGDDKLGNGKDDNGGKGPKPGDNGGGTGKGGKGHG